MTRRNSVGFIYFGVVLATLLLRVASSLDVYAALGVENSDAFYACAVQIFIFGVMSLSLYFLTAGRKDGLRVALNDLGIRRGLSAANWGRVAVIGVCTIVVTSAVSFVWQSILQMTGYIHVSSPTDYDSAGVLVRELVLVALLPATFEEIAHRGLLYAGYRECGWKFVLISALYFALMHQNVVQTGYTFFGGAVMALAMYYTGSIFSGMFIHFLNNAVIVVSGYIEQNGGFLYFLVKFENWIYASAAGLAVGVLLTFVCIALIVIMLIFMRKEAVKKGIISAAPFYTPSGSLPLYKDIPFILITAIGICATVFSLVWGIMR